MATARTRSPNYPSMSLGEAIEAIRKVYAQERRGKFPRLSLASHLGYSSINGRSLSKMGGLRAYSLIEGREDQLAVSSVAIAIMEAPEGSPDSVQAYKVAFLSPPIFARAFEQYGAEPPSPQTFRWWLTQQGYVGEAADRTIQAYLDSLDLVNSKAGGRLPAEVVDEPAQAGQIPQAQHQPRLPEAATAYAARQLKVYAEAAGRAPSKYEPDFKISLGGGRWLLIEVKGGEPTERDFIKLEKFARFQRELLAEDDWAAPDEEDVDPDA